MVDLLKIFKGAHKTEIKALYEGLSPLTTKAVRAIEDLNEYILSKVKNAMIKRADL